MAIKFKPIKIGKNQIFWDGESWVVEVFEYLDGKTPMYSVVDGYTKYKTAIKVAKLVNRNNVSRIMEKMSEDETVRNPSIK